MRFVVQDSHTDRPFSLTSLPQIAGTFQRQTACWSACEPWKCQTFRNRQWSRCVRRAGWRLQTALTAAAACVFALLKRKWRDCLSWLSGSGRGLKIAARVGNETGTHAHHEVSTDHPADTGLPAVSQVAGLPSELSVRRQAGRAVGSVWVSIVSWKLRVSPAHRKTSTDGHHRLLNASARQERLISAAAPRKEMWARLTSRTGWVQHLRKQSAQMLTPIPTPSTLMTIRMRVGIGALFELRKFRSGAERRMCVSARRDRARLLSPLSP